MSGVSSCGWSASRPSQEEIVLNLKKIPLAIVQQQLHPLNMLDPMLEWLPLR
jgi:hypothetical protein